MRSSPTLWPGEQEPLVGCRGSANLVSVNLFAVTRPLVGCGLPPGSAAAIGRGARLVGRTTSSGQDGEFEEFFALTWERAVAIGVRMGLSRPESEDVALDALAVAYDRWARVRGLPWRDGWVLKVTGNRALRQLKRNSRRAQFVASPTRLLDEEVTDRMTLRSGLAGLSRRQREVITLRYLADMSEAEVAAVLGLDVGTVKRHASRARAALKGALDSLQPGGEHGQ